MDIAVSEIAESTLRPAGHVAQSKDVQSQQRGRRSVADGSVTAPVIIAPMNPAPMNSEAPVPADGTVASPGPGDNDLDQVLVKRVQEGDKRAFDLLVRKYQHKVIAVITRYIGDWSEAQDVAQEAFVRAYRALGNFRGESQFYTWLYKIATNTAKNYLVSQGRRPPTDDVQIDDAVYMDAAVKLKDSSTPERELLRQEIERTVFETVEKLPEELRQAITLREVDGLSYEEIAEKMNCPIGTVRSRIFRARDAIDIQLRPLLSEDNAQ
jgi:RNA polymerase sigma-70 factor, ECF subfamily